MLNVEIIDPQGAVSTIEVPRDQTADQFLAAWPWGPGYTFRRWFDANWNVEVIDPQGRVSTIPLPSNQTRDEFLAAWPWGPGYTLTRWFQTESGQAPADIPPALPLPIIREPTYPDDIWGDPRDILTLPSPAKDVAVIPAMSNTMTWVLLGLGLWWLARKF